MTEALIKVQCPPEPGEGPADPLLLPSGCAPGCLECAPEYHVRGLSLWCLCTALGTLRVDQEDNVGASGRGHPALEPARHKASPTPAGSRVYTGPAGDCGGQVHLLC